MADNFTILDSASVTKTKAAKDIGAGVLADQQMIVGPSGEDGLAELLAGLAGIAKGSGITATATFLPTVAAYSAGNVVEGPKQFSFAYGDGTPIPNGSLIRILTVILKVDETAIQSGEGAYALQGYTATPPSNFSNNTAWSLTSADLPSYRGSINLGTPIDLGTACYVKTANVDIDVKLTNASYWAYLQTLGAFTANAVLRQVFLYGIVL